MKHYKSETVREAAKSYGWLEILAYLAPSLQPAIKAGHRRHVPCPVHGGSDGFRIFKDAHQTGGTICNSCGAHTDGFSTLMWANGWDFKTCLEEVGNLLNVEPVEYKKAANGSSSYAKAKTQIAKPSIAHNEQKAEAGTVQRAPGQVVTLVPPSVEVPDWLREQREKMEREAQRQAAYSEALEGRIDKVWAQCVPLSRQGTQPARLYLKSRGIVCRLDPIERADSVRFHPEMSYYDTDGNEVGKFPCIVAAIRDGKGEVITLHRTYLTNNGKKAAVESPKKMMSVPAGKNVNGGCIPLVELDGSGVLGFAEGMETALAAYRATQIPVWSTVNAQLMETVEVPSGIHTVLIWADKDKSMRGEQAATTLKAKLEKQGIKVLVLVPRLPIKASAKGIDWNDILLSQGVMGFPSKKMLEGVKVSVGGEK